MQIIAFKREQEHHKQHIQRIRDTKAMLDSSTPESLGLKHLAIRPKKQQLIEDVRQRTAKENAKLMSGMTKIMNERRNQPNYVAPVSLNETERKREVDRMNFENKLMLERLNKMTPTLSNAKLESDFKKHLHAESNLRRKQMKPLSLPKDLYRTKEKSSLFDSATYASQHETLSSVMNGSTSNLSILQENDSPIKSMKEFRQHVISAKKVAARGMNHPSPSGINETATASASHYHSTNNSNNTTSSSSSRRAMHNNNHSQADYSRTEALFELSHNPTSTLSR